VRHLILGSSAAGIAAADVLRQNCPGDKITMVTADEAIHSRCMLYQYLSRERDKDSLNFTRENFFKQSDIELILNSPAISVNTKDKTVVFEKDIITYDRLLIATGASSFIPNIPGLHSCKNAYTLGSLSDAVSIRKAARKATTIAIIGSGLVGMGVAYALDKYNADIHVIEMANHILPAQLDHYVASEYQSQFEKKGAEFHLAREISDVLLLRSGRAVALEFDKQSILPCDMIIVTAGNSPNTGFLENSGIELNNGVVVNKHMLTSVADVYAAGDVTGIATNWYAAVKQGRVAGHNMANRDCISYDEYFHLASSINFGGTTAISIGKVTPPDNDCKVLVYNDEEQYLKLVMKDGVAIGVLLFGDISHSGHWRYMVKNAVPLDNLGKTPNHAAFVDFFDIDSHTAEFRYK